MFSLAFFFGLLSKFILQKMSIIENPQNSKKKKKSKYDIKIFIHTRHRQDTYIIANIGSPTPTPSL